MVNISDAVAAQDFVLDAAWSIGSADVWLMESSINSNQFFDDFSGSLSWAIFSDAGSGPATLIQSGSSVDLISTYTGQKNSRGSEIFKVSFSFDVPTILQSGAYWLALHEGPWGSPCDGSTIWWARAPVQNQPVWYTVNVMQPETGWVTGFNDYAFVLYSIGLPPTDIQISSAFVDENDAGAVIGTLVTADPDLGDTHRYSVSDTRFEVVAGQLKLVDGVALDFETAESLTSS